MKKINKKVIKNEKMPIIMGFLIPVMFFFAIWLLYRIYPLSSKSLVPYDAQHQYVPFLQEFKTKLLNGEDFFFSTRMASTDFYTEWLYYLTSPFNLLALFTKDIIIGFQLILILKIGCIGASMAVYLKKVYSNQGLYTSIFACAYAMSAYVMSYYFSIMWLDILILLPWLIYYFNEMIKNENPYIYSIILALVIYSNFFMAMHVCIFLCIYFILQGHKTIKDFFKKGLLFAWYSVLGGGLSAVFFVPFLNLLGDKVDRYPGSYILSNFVSLFLNFGAMAKKQVSMDYASGANFYCGVITLILFIMYLMNERFDKIDRLRNLIIVTFIFLCTNVSDLDYFMNGFYKTNGYMGRYTYISIFFIVCCGYKEFIYLKNEKKSRKIIVPLITSILFAAAFAYLSFIKEIEDWQLITASLSFAICFLFIFVLFTNAFNKKSALCFILMAELLITGVNKIKCSDMGTILETKNDISVIYQETNARQVILEESIHNEETLNRMNGVSLFSSSLPKEVSRFQYKVGLRGGSNYITAYGCEMIPSLIYNIQYIYGDSEEYVGFSKVDENGGRGLFKNNYDTYYAYAVPDSLMNWNWDTTNVFNNLNTFVSFFTEGKLFTIVDDTEMFLESNYESYESYYDEDGFYRVKFKKGDGDHIEISTIAKKPEVALKVNNGYFKKCEIYINDEVYLSDDDIEGDTVFLKGVNKGDKISIYVDCKKEEGKVGAAFAYYNTDTYERFANEFTSRGLDVDFKSNKISGYYEIKENESIMLSVPSIEGWTVYSDKIKLQIKDFPLIMFKPADTEGRFEAHYITPLFMKGLYITIASFVIISITLIIYSKKTKKTI